MTAHTPGPWRFQRVDRNGIYIYADHGVLARTYRAPGGEGVEDANAALLAAAPAMLQALDDLVHALAPLEYDDEALEPGSGQARAAYYARPEVHAALAAIAKARGGVS